MVSNSRTVNNIIGALLAIILTFLCFGSTYAVEPEKPWPEDLGDGDRLYASYLNGMFGVLYNWCQNKQIILDNLLNNGNGVASVTASLGKFDNLSVPELDNLLHNGTGIASLTANLLKALQEVEAPLYKVNGRTDAPSVNTDDGYIYYDIDTQRLMGYQEGHWRDLSPVTVVGTDSLHSPLIIEGYLETTNSYVENRVVIGNASESHNEIGTVSAKIDFGNDGAIRIPVNSNPNQLNTEFGTGSIAYNPTTKKLLVYDGSSWISPVPEITVDNALSYDSENPVQNKVIANTFLQKENNSFSYIANAITTVVKNVHDQMTTITGVPALNSWPSGGTTSHETPKLQEAYNSLKALIDYIRSYVNSNDTATLNSAKAYADSKDTATLNSAKSYVDTKVAAIPSPTVDSAMSSTSTNPVQNKVVKDYIDNHTSEAGVIPTTMPSNPTEGTIYWDGDKIKIYTGGSWHTATTYNPILDASNYYNYNYVLTEFHYNRPGDDYNFTHNWESPLGVFGFSYEMPYIEYTTVNNDNMFTWGNYYNSGEIAILGERKTLNENYNYVKGYIIVRFLIPILSVCSSSDHESNDTVFKIDLRPLENYCKNKYSDFNEFLYSSIYGGISVVDYGFIFETEVYRYGNTAYRMRKPSYGDSYAYQSHLTPIFTDQYDNDLLQSIGYYCFSLSYRHLLHFKSESNAYGLNCNTDTYTSGTNPECCLLWIELSIPFD